ncbi:N-(5'-phosphoribosyl)anthranilate isomerase [Psychromarinibacter sp. C21-152]|uniref:N-(5'-phosphoribosyl)anthranilate isomerase n=1 Tax=Psychromarinibacter sediminicola TaxID=3033385 RepID=A0AAE3NST5_9RHOB|nr:N-(5'-phosphoribosyl)anthranilate isomerase [Psychromarinibacter sediminicola]MDF0601804.1 N-(5'-phosphoribosyl)anthranilate isomerase [Psychromarinibacter sediminicola]
MESPVHTRPEAWIAHVFSAKAAMRGGVIRRSVAWVRNEIGEDRFVDEVRLRGFHLLECGGQFVVVCNRAPIRRLV